LFEGLTFKVADATERLQAFDLQRKVYGEDVGHVPSDEFDERAHYLVAHDSDHEVVAAFRVVGPDLRPFDLEDYVDLSPYVAPDRRVALVGRLCIRHDHRRVSKRGMLPIGMLKLAFAFSQKCAFTDFVMYTFPDLVAFYRSALFHPLGLSFIHPGYQCRMHVMHLDLIDLKPRMSGSRSPMAQLLLSVSPPNFVV